MAPIVGILLGLIAGLVAGSFIGVLTLRWPAGRGLGGRSACDACGAMLGPFDLVPLLSFALLRGRCRHCAAPIAPRHLAIELAGGAVGALALWLVPGWGGVAGAGLGWVLLALLVLDVEHFWLPDRLTLPLAGAGLLAGLWLPPALPLRLAGALVGFGLLWVLAAGYRRLRGFDGMGGGDPKLFAAIGAWLGPWVLPLVMAAAAGLGLALVGLDRLRGRPVMASTRVPLGALLAGAGWLAWLAAPWLVSKGYM